MRPPARGRAVERAARIMLDAVCASGACRVPLTDLGLAIVLGGAAVCGVLYVAAWCAARLDRHRLPHGRPFGEMAAFAHLGDPSEAWHASVAGPWLYWPLAILALTLSAVVIYGGWRVLHPRARTPPTDDPITIEGLADRHEVKKAAGPRTVLGQAGILRPSVQHPRPADVGWCLGRSRGVECWIGVRDSMTLLGPPGAGKGLHFVISAVLDAPGAVITTNTRPDNLTATMTARAKVGPVGVFDPEGLAPGVPSALRWSPVRGCERSQTAMVRAAALCADGGKGVTDANYWEKRTLTAVRCLLHAAAVGGRGAESLYEWSLSPAAAREAVSILATSPAATPRWDRALDAVVGAEERMRDSVWSMVANAFDALADPKVLAAVTPAAEERFDPAGFLRERGTLYLLGTAGGKEATGTANLVSALIEDIVRVARRLAAGSPGARLDPPLALILDEAANYPLPSLASLMSEGGGTGMPTMVVLQSLAQARDNWGQEQADAIWDASTAKVILGGSSNADDLSDLSRMIGERTIRERSESWGGGRGVSFSESDRQRTILDPAMIRTLDFDHGLLMLRSAKPIMLSLTPWTARPDAGRIRSDRAGIEETIRTAAAKEWAAGHAGTDR
jgi:type IV secretion system protein VirD4